MTAHNRPAPLCGDADLCWPICYEDRTLLGADICWPILETSLRELDLALPLGGDTVRFEVERVTIEPFDLRQPVRYDVVIDRLTHWYHTSREWIKKAVVMNDVYVFNNPWSVQSMEKQTTVLRDDAARECRPETWLLPPKEYEESPDLRADPAALRQDVRPRRDRRARRLPAAS